MTFDQMRSYLLNVERIVFFLLVSVAVMGSLVLAHDWSVHPWLPDSSSVWLRLPQRAPRCCSAV